MVIRSWRAGRRLPTIMLIVVMIATAILFSSLRIEVADGELRWYLPTSAE